MTSTSTITAGDGVRWQWQMPNTRELHSTTSGLCLPPPGPCDISTPILWNSPIQTSGSFPAAASPAAITAPFTVAGTYDYFCTVHLWNMVGQIVVLPGVLDHFDVTGNPVAAINAGSSFTITLTARDQFNNKKTNYTGTVTFSVTNPHSSGGEVPVPYTFVLADDGDRNFTFTLKTAGSRTITIQDGAVQKQFTVTVNAAATNQLVVTNVPATANAGNSFQVTVTARDQFNNTATGYDGTVHFTSSDAGAATVPACIAPQSCSLISGTRNFNVTLANAGSQSLTVTDTANGALTATANINVSVACSITFSNPAAITIPVFGAATPYPSTISVAGLKQTITGLSVTINGLNHQFGRDTDILLVSPGGQKMIILSDSGGGANDEPVTNATITLTDSAASLLPDEFGGGPLVSGTFKPTNNGVGDVFPDPVPAPPYFSPLRAETATPATFASVFNGIDPNGTWSLYVADDLGGGFGSISSGWSLTFAPPANTFCNQSAITLPGFLQSNPYPSDIEVSNVDGTIRNVSLRLDKLTKQFPMDLDLLLVGPLPGGNPRMVILSDVGGGGVNNAVVTLDDSGPIAAGLSSGIFHPTNQIEDADSFPGPAPVPPYSNAPPSGIDSFATTFNGINPNGTWKLYVVDDLLRFAVPPFIPPEPTGSIAGGWALSFDVIFNTTTTLGSNNNPAAVGQFVALTANVTSAGPGTPTGTVTFRLGTSDLATIPLVDGTASGFSLEPVAGVFNLTAIYSGDANFHPSTSTILVQTVNPGPTTTSVVSLSPSNTSTFGQSVTCTATVSDPSNPYTPTGTVTFKDGAVVLDTRPLVFGMPPTATFTTSALTAGSHSITAVYDGDSNFAASTSAILTQTVNKAATTAVVVSSSPTSTYGNSVTFTATVTENTPGTPPLLPTGTVTFRDGPTTIGTGTLNSGATTLITNAVSGGNRSITVEYGGDSNFLGSTSPGITQTVNKRTPDASVISFQNPSVFGELVTFRADVTASVTPPAVGPTGTVTLKDGAATLGSTALTSGTAQITTAPLGGGIRAITAEYGGDGNFNSIIATLSPPQQVDPAETATGLGTSGTPSAFGQLVTFTATVTSGVGTPAGTVTFMDGTTPLGPGTLNGLGIATLTTFALRAGEHSITATYNGNGSFASSTSAAVMQNVNPSATTVFLTVSKATSVFREAVTFTASLDFNPSATATGTVTFFDGATNLGSASLNEVAEASITLSGLTVGKHVITVEYSGDSNYLPANSEDPLVHYRSPKPR